MKTIIGLCITLFAMCSARTHETSLNGGSGPEMIAEGNNPAISGILFAKSPGGLNTGGTLDLMMYDPATQQTRLILQGSVNRRGEYDATTSADNSKIIFSTYRYTGWKLGIADFSNGEISNLRKLSSRPNYEYNGCFSPDGSKIIYQEYNWGSNESEIFLADQNGENARPVFKPGISNQPLNWTTDSESIVFTAFRGEHLKICRQSVITNSFSQLTNGDANDFAPSTSKVSHQIAFLSDRSGKIDLFVMDLEDGASTNLTATLNTSDADINSIWAYRTSWSPDGKQIVFNAMVDQSLELFIVNSDGTGLQRITDNRDTEMTPFWMY